jgi:uncharacterized glyoxalase superfamily protein PhnB
MSDRTNPTIFPALRYRDANAAIDWLGRAFGLQEKVVYRGEDGAVQHAELTLGRGLVMLGQYSEEGWMGGNGPDARAGTVSLYATVDDPDSPRPREGRRRRDRARAGRPRVRLTRVQRPRHRGQPLVVRHLPAVRAVAQARGRKKNDGWETVTLSARPKVRVAGQSGGGTSRRLGTEGEAPAKAGPGSRWPARFW